MRGVVVAVFDSPDVAYEVEFCDVNGDTLAEVVLRCEQDGSSVIMNSSGHLPFQYAAVYEYRPVQQRDHQI